METSMAAVPVTELFDDLLITGTLIVIFRPTKEVAFASVIQYKHGNNSYQLNINVVDQS